ncbi:unnamed protein product [Wickerhamomyces anomalus]
MMSEKDMELKPTSSHAENSADSNDAGSNDAGEVVPFAHLSPDTQDVDEAMGVAIDLEEKHFLWTPEKDKKLLLKIDLYMLPLICFLYARQYMDKTSNSYAAIMGLKTDLHMRGDMYSWTEKLMVVERIRDNKQGFGNKHFKRYQFKESLFDPMTWLFFVLAIVSQIPNGAITNFGTILLADDFHYSETESLLMNCISGAVEIIGCLGYSSFNYFYSP